MYNLVVQKFLKHRQTELLTVHRVRAEHTGEVWEGKEQPGQGFSAKRVYMETEPT